MAPLTLRNIYAIMLFVMSDIDPLTKLPVQISQVDSISESLSTIFGEPQIEAGVIGDGSLRTEALRDFAFRDELNTERIIGSIATQAIIKNALDTPLLTPQRKKDSDSIIGITSISKFLDEKQEPNKLESYFFREDPFPEESIYRDDMLIDKGYYKYSPLLPLPDLEAETKKEVAKGKAARLFRRQKLRASAMGELLEDIADDADMRQQVAPLVQAREAFQKGTTKEHQTHRDLSALFAALFSDPELKDKTVAALDQSATEESDSLKQEMRDNKKRLEADVVIVGAGVHGSIIAARLRADNPDARIIAIEQSNKLGGQFRKYGNRPSFFINSRNNRPQDTSKTGLPGGAGNLNSFGEKAPVQVTDISAETYPTNLELGHTSAINQYLSAETVLDVVTESVDAETGNVTMLDLSTNEVFEVTGSKVIITTGLGERRKPPFMPGLMTAEDLLSHFGNKDNKFPMADFVDKRVAIIGGGDSGRICAELFTRLAPKDAYGKSVVQLGGPKLIKWYGTDFRNREEFCATNRPRYQRLASFISESSFDDGIRVTEERIGDIEQSEAFDQMVDLYGTNGRKQGTFDIVIDARSLPNPKDEVRDITDAALSPINGYLADIGEIAQIGMASDNDRIYLAGPAAESRLSPSEVRSYSARIGENTVAIWANAVRSEEIASKVGRSLN